MSFFQAFEKAAARAKKPLGPSLPGKKSFHNHAARAIAHNEKNEKKRSVHIHYQKLNGRTVKRKIDPRSMRGNTLVAYDHKRKAIRSFRMERVKHMEKAAQSDFWAGFEKEANAFGHAAELAGLGILAAPSVQKLRGKPMSESATHKSELAGLGVLAAPSAVAAAHGAWNAAKPGLTSAARGAVSAAKKLRGAVHA